MAHSAPEVWQPHLPGLAPLLGDAVEERYYKVTAEALRTLEQLVTVVRPNISVPIPAAMKVRCLHLMFPFLWLKASPV